MTNQSVTIFATDGDTWWAKNASAAGLAEMAAIEPLVKITKINSTEIDLQYQTVTIFLNGTFNLSSLSTTPQTLLDLLNTSTNFQSTSFISNVLNINTSTNPSG